MTRSLSCVCETHSNKCRFQWESAHEISTGHLDILLITTFTNPDQDVQNHWLPHAHRGAVVTVLRIKS